MANRYDNLAYNYYNTSSAPAYDNPYNTNVHIKKSPEKATVKKAKYNYSGVIKVALVIIFAFFVLARGVMITEKVNEIDKKKKELQNIQAKNEMLQVEIEKSLDLTRIEELASDKLNMRRPEKYQIVYINLERVDYVEKAEGTETSPFSKAARLFNNAKSYLD